MGDSPQAAAADALEKMAHHEGLAVQFLMDTPFGGEGDPTHNVGSLALIAAGLIRTALPDLLSKGDNADPARKIIQICLLSLNAIAEPMLHALDGFTKDDSQTDKDRDEARELAKVLRAGFPGCKPVILGAEVGRYTDKPEPKTPESVSPRN